MPSKAVRQFAKDYTLFRKKCIQEFRRLHRFTCKDSDIYVLGFDDIYTPNATRLNRILGVNAVNYLGNKNGVKKQTSS